MAPVGQGCARSWAPSGSVPFRRRCSDSPAGAHAGTVHLMWPRKSALQRRVDAMMERAHQAGDDHVQLVVVLEEYLRLAHAERVGTEGFFLDIGAWIQTPRRQLPGVGAGGGCGPGRHRRDVRRAQRGRRDAVCARGETDARRARTAGQMPVEPGTGRLSRRCVDLRLGNEPDLDDEGDCPGPVPDRTPGAAVPLSTVTSANDVSWRLTRLVR